MNDKYEDWTEIDYLHNQMLYLQKINEKLIGIRRNVGWLTVVIVLPVLLGLLFAGCSLLFGGAPF